MKNAMKNSRRIKLLSMICIIFQLLIVFLILYFPTLENILSTAFVLSLAAGLAIIEGIFIFNLIRFIEVHVIEEMEIEKQMIVMNNNRKFFRFFEMQQENIRHYYHDLSNHLTTIKLLKLKGEFEESEKYKHAMQMKYKDTIPQNITGHTMLDILISYYHQQEGFSVTYEGGIPDKNSLVDLVEVLSSIKDSIINKKISVNFTDKIIIKIFETNNEIQEQLNKLMSEHNVLFLSEVKSND